MILRIDAPAAIGIGFSNRPSANAANIPCNPSRSPVASTSRAYRAVLPQQVEIFRIVADRKIERAQHPEILAPDRAGLGEWPRKLALAQQRADAVRGVASIHKTSDTLRLRVL